MSILQEENIVEIVAEENKVDGTISHYVYYKGEKLPHVIGTIVTDYIDDIQRVTVELYCKIRESAKK